MCDLSCEFCVSPQIYVLNLTHKKEGSWNMFLEYSELIKITIKETFLVIVIDELFDELQGVILFTKLGLHYGYH